MAKPVVSKSKKHSITKSRTPKFSHTDQIRARKVAKRTILIAKKRRQRKKSKSRIIPSLSSKKNEPNSSKIVTFREFKKQIGDQSISHDQFGIMMRLTKRYGNNLSAVLSSVKKMRALEMKYGKSYDDIITDYESKKKEVEEATTNLRMVEKQKETLSLQIEHVKALRDIQTFLVKNQANAQELIEYISQQKGLVQLGFGPDSVRAVAEEMKRLKLDPRKLARMIGISMSNNRTIEQALTRSEERLAEANKEQTLALARVESLNRQADEAEKRIAALQEYYTTQRRALENEYEARRRVLDLRIQEARSSAETETLEILKQRDLAAAEVRTLKEEVDAIRKEITARNEPPDSSIRN